MAQVVIEENPYRSPSLAAAEEIDGQQLSSPIRQKIASAIESLLLATILAKQLLGSKTR